MEMGGVCGARSGLVDVWVMHGMAMDEKLHVFPGGGIGELPRCVNRRCLRCTIWACSADCFKLEVRCCLHGAFRVFGEVSV